MVAYSGARPASVPVWEERWPGRLQYELDRIADRATGDVTIDDQLLESGQLRIRFAWPLTTGEQVELQATYPSTFPRFRPQVQLIADPSTFPDRHVGPNGELCLLGRDSGLWQSRTTLSSLLDTNLANALTGSGPEDPQGEPVEVWWNTAKSYDRPNYLLVDSEWDLTGYDGGIADIVYRFDILDGSPSFRAAINKIWTADEMTLLAARTFAIPADLEAAGTKSKATWNRDDTLPLPHRDQLDKLLERADHKGWYEKKNNGTLRVSLTVQRTELQHAVEGDGFICVVALTRAVGKGVRTERFHAPVYRAGTTDVGYRVPSTAVLRGSNVVVIGLGALGSPLAIELARNGVAKLTLVDHDTVEPGNSVRWALGATAWGKRKSVAIAEHIRSEYPWTDVVPLDANIGFGSAHGDEVELVERLVAGADIVIDSSASTGVTNYLSDECRRKGKSLVSVAGTVSLKGGTVSVYRPNSGCPVCREHAYFDGQFARAPGATDYSELTQPPGCAENTFTGASFDLQELAMQAVRAAVDVLDGSPQDTSVIQTLSLHDGTHRTLPAWTENMLPPSPKCGCTP